MTRERTVEHPTNWVGYDAPFVRRRYNRLAKHFVFYEWLFLLPSTIRNEAVSRLELKSGGRVLEVGCGTGRNLCALVGAVGPEGHVYGIDVSEGMLEPARDLCRRAEWSNVTLTRADASDYVVPEPVDGVIFSLSYAVIPRHRDALRQAWARLRSGGIVVIMDAKLPPSWFGRLLRPLVVWTSRLTVLGNPDIRPWDELAELTDEMSCEEWQSRTYYICRGRKR